MEAERPENPPETIAEYRMRLEAEIGERFHFVPMMGSHMYNVTSEEEAQKQFAEDREFFRTFTM